MKTGGEGWRLAGDTGDMLKLQSQFVPIALNEEWYCADSQGS
jgi:hypothetical protein